ncbi:MAG: hypothetical protein F4139_14505 [Gemmatimonadetes bacterium]|nr:hypothetical protein [Gemmatimonadota bacterium]MYH54130.1 hypothetical protein [Gemmatimonadota bacterium]MYK67731.1 hypothetical protein [Gemmatimonadota bacterium]
MLTRRAATHRVRAPGVHRCLALLALAASAWTTLPLSAQETEGVNGDRPSVFLDCATRGCNREYFRTEITWVNWVRVPESSDVHIIMTGQTTGAGGREFQLDFMGRGDFEYEHQLAHQAPPTATDRETLDELVGTINAGLLHFATLTGFLEDAGEFREIANLINVETEEFDPGERVMAQNEVDDPWDFWVFRLGGRTELEGEQTRRTNQINGNWSASRVTPTWKMNFRANMQFNRREIDLADDSTFVDQRTDWGFTELIAYSLADHWSIGLEGEARKVVRFNQTFRIELTPALEYSFFPYEEATRRSFTVFYQIGPAYRRYIEKTVHGYLEETRWEQALEIELSQRQQWGDASIRLQGSHFLHDTDLYNISLRGDLEFRIARGLSINGEANISWVNDQIYLSAEGATDAEALLNLQQRAQDFNYGIEVGFSFQFGSIYNNVVNNRFGGGGFNWWR